MRRIICCFIAVLVLSMSIVWVSAEEVNNVMSGIGAFKISGFGYYDAQGNEIKELTAGAEIHTKVNLEKKNVGIEKAILIVCVMENGNVIDVKSDSKSFTSVGDTQGLDAVITLPSGVSAENIIKNYSLESYLWHGWLEMQPLGSFSVFGSDDAGISRVTIDNKPLSGFSSEVTEYNMELPASTGSNIEIDALCRDLGTTYTSSVNNGVITIASEAQSGNKMNYTINYTKKAPEASAEFFVYNTSGEHVPNKLQPDIVTLKSPKYIYDKDGNVQAFGADFADYVTRVYYDNYLYFSDIPEQLEGAMVVKLNRTPCESCDYARGFDLKLTLNKSARVYFPFTDTKAEDIGAIKSDVGNQVKIKSLGNAWADATTSVPDPTKAGERLWCGTMYEKELIVPAGEEATLFEINNVGTGLTYGATVIIEWIEN